MFASCAHLHMWNRSVPTSTACVLKLLWTGHWAATAAIKNQEMGQEMGALERADLALRDLIIPQRRPRRTAKEGVWVSALVHEPVVQQQTHVHQACAAVVAPCSYVMFLHTAAGMYWRAKIVTCSRAACVTRFA